MVKSGAQKNRFPGEFEILEKYGSLNALAENLYRDGQPNESAISEFKAIHHLKESISFYLHDLVNQLGESQIFAVIATEFIEQDVSEYLGVGNLVHLHKHRETHPMRTLSLSKLATQNLAMVLEDDYLVIKKLLKIKTVPPQKEETLLRKG